jgi:hypothetical protein
VRDLATLRPHPENPHKGDEEAIGESIEANGGFGAIGVQASTGYILHGNHTYKQLRARGEAEFACIVYDVDDDLARRIMVAHNETQRGGKTDERKMADVLSSLTTTRGLGIRPPEVSRLLEMARPKLSFLEKMRAAETAEDALAMLGPPPREDDGDEEPGSAEDDAESDGDQEDYEDEHAAGPLPESEEDDGDDVPEFSEPAAADRPRLPLAIVLSTNELRRWDDYKKRVGERNDKKAFLVLLAAATNTDP